MVQKRKCKRIKNWWIRHLGKNLKIVSERISEASRGGANYIKMDPRCVAIAEYVATETNQSLEQVMSDYLGHPTKIIEVINGC